MSQLAACLDISPNGSCHWGIRLPIPLFGARRASPDACYTRQDVYAGSRADYPSLYNGVRQITPAAVSRAFHAAGRDGA